MKRVLRELFFPPICVECKELTEKPYFCNLCWEQSALLSPSERCLHCFGPTDPTHPLCGRCAHRPIFPFPRAALFEREAPLAKLARKPEMVETVAALAYLQWTKLEWETPDYLIVFPPSQKQIGTALAKAIGCTAPTPFRRKTWPPQDEEWFFRYDQIREDETVLLFDVGCTFHQLRFAIYSLLEAFPKKGFVLSLII